MAASSSSQGDSCDPARFSAEANAFMREALKLADEAAALGEVPVGAIVVLDGVVIGRGHNRQITDNDPSAHAEVVAMRKAALALRNYRLTDAILYSTIEPCTMCLGACVHARVKRIVYGAPEPRAGATALLAEGALLHSTSGKRFNHVPEVESGCLAVECGDRLIQFFRNRRKTTIPSGDN